MTSRLLLLLPLTLLLTACEIPGLGPDPRITQREADGKAIGGACRHALRGIEDCYALNARASKTAIFEGWKEMDVYMRENKIEGIAPKVARESPQPQPTEEIIEESKSPSAGHNKTSDRGSQASDVALAASRGNGASRGH